MNKQKQGFTLVELIVVITILAILGTIAFISLQGYSAQSRDSTRISDLSTMRTSLELFHLEAGKYPITTEGTDITYSGGVVWSQGTFGETVFKNVDKLDKIPKDPLVDKKYTYSVTTKRNEYQLAGITETDLAINILEDTYAGDIEAKAIIKGNYNGQTVQSLSGTTVVTCSMLALPSIIANNLEITTDLAQIIASGSLVYDGYSNLPASYNGSKFDLNGGFAFEPNKLLAYSDTGSCVELTNKSDSTARVELIIGLQDAYTGTLVENIGSIKRIIDLGTITLGSPTTEVKNFAASYINNVLGGNVEIVTGGAEEVIDTCLTNLTQNQVDIINGIWTNGNYDLDLYGGVGGSTWYDPDAENGFTIEEYCDNVTQVYAYTNPGITSDLVLAYKEMTNLELVYFEGDFLSNKSVLETIDVLSLRIESGYHADVFALTNLIGLSIRNTSIGTIPASVSTLTGLKYLTLQNVGLTTLPNELWTLNNLEYLHLYNNSITSLSSSIENLTNLNFLHIGTNGITTFPTELANLNNFTKLDISNNGMTTLPPVILNLTNLTFLNIGNNNFSTFPAGLSSLTNLTSLWFGYNGTALVIPVEIGSMNTLTTILFSSLGLTTLPTELGNLTNLITFSLQSNSGLGNLSFYFQKTSTTKTQGGMTIVGNGTTIDISGVF